MVTLYNKDCLEVMKTFQDESIDLIATDPPYKVMARGSSGNAGGMLLKDINRQGKVFQFNDIDCTEYAPEFYRILKDGSHCYVMTNHINLQHMLNTFTKCGFHFIKSLIWDKGNKIMGQFYMSQFEYILFFRKGTGIKINNCGTSDLLSIPNVKTKGTNGDNLHDTEKPVELMRILIENSSKKGDVVFEPFMGSGSTGVAAKMTDRDFIGCEIDPHYFEICQNRIDGVSSSIVTDKESLW